MGDQQRIIVITGVTRGLGRALCTEFVERGHRVVGCGRSPELVTQLSETFPESCRFDLVDVSYADEVSAWAEQVIEEVGTPDLLINNAAIINAPAPLWEVPLADFQQLININVKGVFHVIRGFVPAMVAAKRGVIINLSSGWGRSVSPEVASYCASKYAIEGLTQAMALELPEEMAAIPLNPGVIDTEMLRSCWGEDAGMYPDAVDWAKRAAPFILDLGPKDSGQSLSVELGRKLNRN